MENVLLLFNGTNEYIILFPFEFNVVDLATLFSKFAQKIVLLLQSCFFSPFWNIFSKQAESICIIPDCSDRGFL